MAKEPRWAWQRWTWPFFDKHPVVYFLFVWAVFAFVMPVFLLDSRTSYRSALRYSCFAGFIAACLFAMQVRVRKGSKRHREALGG